MAAGLVVEKLRVRKFLTGLNKKATVGRDSIELYKADGSEG
jgi:hypothetical protein